jgi:hypothetical protein
MEAPHRVAYKGNQGQQSRKNGYISRNGNWEKKDKICWGILHKNRNMLIGPISGIMPESHLAAYIENKRT